MNTVATITGILVLATLVESLVEYLIRPIAKPWEPGDPPADANHLELRDLALRYGAALIGILLCIAYGADLLALVGLSTPVPWVGPIVTGLLVGRGANFVHDFASRWLGPVKALR